MISVLYKDGTIKEKEFDDLLELSDNDFLEFLDYERTNTIDFVNIKFEFLITKFMNVTFLKEIIYLYDEVTLSKNEDNYVINSFHDGYRNCVLALRKLREITNILKEFNKYIEAYRNNKKNLKTILKTKLKKNHVCLSCFYSKKLKRATQDDGEYVYQCTNCGESYKKEFATNFLNIVNDNDEEKDLLKHIYRNYSLKSKNFKCCEKSRMLVFGVLRLSCTSKKLYAVLTVCKNCLKLEANLSYYLEEKKNDKFYTNDDYDSRTLQKVITNNKHTQYRHGYNTIKIGEIKNAI